MRRLVIRPGAIGDFIVSLPALECLQRRLPGSLDRLAERPAGAVRGPARSIASTGLDLLGVTEPPPRACWKICGSSIPSSPGTARTGRSSATWWLGWACRSLSFRRCRARAAGVHATDFYLEQVRAIAPRARATASRAFACHGRARELRRDPSRSPAARGRTGRSKDSARWRAAWSGACRSAGAPARKIRRSKARCASTISTSWPAGWRGRACTSATIPASRTWRRPWERRCWRCSGPPIPEVWGPRGPHVRVGRWQTATDARYNRHAPSMAARLNPEPAAARTDRSPPDLRPATWILCCAKKSPPGGTIWSGNSTNPPTWCGALWICARSNGHALMVETGTRPAISTTCWRRTKG